MLKAVAENSGSNFKKTSQEDGRSFEDAAEVAYRTMLESTGRLRRLSLFRANRTSTLRTPNGAWTDPSLFCFTRLQYLDNERLLATRTYKTLLHHESTLLES